MKRWHRKRPLHLLEVGVRWPPETFIGWKLEALAAHGMRVTVASQQVFDSDARLRGVDLVEIPSRPLNLAAATRVAWHVALAILRTSPIGFARLVRSVRRDTADLPYRRYRRLTLLALGLRLKRLRPDVVHFEWHSAASHSLPLLDFWDCPVTTSFRGSDIRVYPHTPGMERYASRLPKVLVKASAVHCVSESLKTEAVAFGLDPAKVRLARPAVDPELFKPAVNRGDGDDGLLRAIMVGWLRWEKGHEYALVAIRTLLDRDVAVQLEIVGSVPAERRRRMDERARILHTIADLGLKQHVRLAGEASSAEISARLRASDVFLHASVTEGTPNAIVEAMACGLPVVAVRCGGVPEAVTDGVEGFLVPPRDPERLAESLQRLWQDDDLRIRMGRAGRRKVISANLTLEHEHRVFMDMYREVAGA